MPPRVIVFSVLEQAELNIKRVAKPYMWQSTEVLVDHFLFEMPDNMDEINMALFLAFLLLLAAADGVLEAILLGIASIYAHCKSGKGRSNMFLVVLFALLLDCSVTDIVDNVSAGREESDFNVPERRERKVATLRAIVTSIQASAEGKLFHTRKNSSVAARFFWRCKCVSHIHNW